VTKFQDFQRIVIIKIQVIWNGRIERGSCSIDIQADSEMMNLETAYMSDKGRYTLSFISASEVRDEE
jgi:hypothetical protein